MIVQDAPMINELPNKVKVTNRYLLLTFLKVGSISFGGNMALLSMVERIMVEKDKSFTAKLYFDAISIASFLPGPLAVNVVTFIGYTLNKKWGALISLVAILLPACLLMLLLSWIYFSFSLHYNSSEVIHYMTGAVSAIILTTAVAMYRKEVGKSISKNVACGIAFTILLLTSNYLFIVGLLLFGVLVGVSNRNKNTTVIALPNLNGGTPSRFVLNYRYVFVIGLLVLIECLFLFNVQSFIENIYIRIVMVFSGISLSLFGGGFVAVPMMQSLFVNDLKWLTSEEFVDAIAFSQLTPGPILVSATFIGYKMGGVAGALLATLSMFAPSAMLIILVSKVHRLHQDNVYVRHALEGVKVVIIGMIAASAFKIIANDVYNMKAMSLCFVMFIAIHFFKVSPFLIILFAALLGFLVEKVI